jgi:glycine/D-amino acid oxidase-like deaminating enzyme
MLPGASASYRRAWCVMKLKTGKPLWPALSPPLVTVIPLQHDLRCEAVVLGAGVTGAMAACELAGAGIETVVIDRRGAVQGSTPASTALLLYEIDTSLIQLRKRIGAEAAARAYRCSRRALDGVANLVERHRVDCDLHWNGSLYLALKKSDLDWFEHERAARSEIQIEVDFLDHAQLLGQFDIDRPGALYSRAAIEVDPFKLTHGLLAAAQNLGVRIYQADVSINDSSQFGNTLATSEGFEIRCSNLVIATGYETPELFGPVRSLCSVYTTYVLASEPIDGDAWPGRALVWEAASPYLYARQTADNRVIVGGVDDPGAGAGRNEATLARKAEELQRKLAQLRPGLHVEPAYVWSGIFAETDDGLPFIGTHQNWPRAHFALGYGGNGITFSVLAAQIIRDSIMGNQNADAAIFGFSRM